MLLRRPHTEHFTLPRQLLLSSPPKIPLPDRDVLLGYQLRFLPHDIHNLTTALWRDEYLGRGAESRHCSSPIRAVQLAELSVPN